VSDRRRRGRVAIGRKHYALAIDRARHVGETVAAVIAATEARLDVRRRCRVDWEPLPATERPLAARKAGAPQVHADAAGNVEHENRITAGDPDAAFAKAFKVVRQRMVSQRLCGVPMEGRATLAAPDSTTGGLVVWATTQAPHGFRNGLATLLGLDQNQIRVIAPEVGGGRRFRRLPEDAALAAMAVLPDAPKVETRGAHGGDHPGGPRHRRGGALERTAPSAACIHVLADIGAYLIFTFIPDLALMMGVGVTSSPTSISARRASSPTTPVAAYRGAGREGSTTSSDRRRGRAQARHDARAVRRKNCRARRLPVHDKRPALRQRRARPP
jgi:carbon-monoxide dehydrogenase large subunit